MVGASMQEFINGCSGNNQAPLTKLTITLRYGSIAPESIIIVYGTRL